MPVSARASARGYKQNVQLCRCENHGEISEAASGGLGAQKQIEGVKRWHYEREDEILSRTPTHDTYRVQLAARVPYANDTVTC